MAIHMHVDARSWVRGEKPWEQFLVYCDRLLREQGTQLWAAQLTDERLFDAYREALADKDSGEEHRPQLFGYDRIAEGLHALRLEIALLHRQLAQNVAYPLPKGPEFPGERFAKEDEDAEISDLFTEIEQAMQDA